MATPDEFRQWADEFHKHGTDQDSLFALVAGLANLLDRDLVVETMASVLGKEPEIDGDCVTFDDIAIRFGPDNRVRSVFRTIDGSRAS